MNTTCPICETTGAAPFFELMQVPVYVGVPYGTAEAARNCPRGDIRLLFCRNCGCIWNAAFDPALVEYDGDYDNSLDHSPLFRTYARSLAERLVERYGVRGKRVIDIGCGKGDFLRLICEVGGNNGVGFDPTYRDDKARGPCCANVRFVRDYYSPKYAEVQGDLICCRHVFEHVHTPQRFLGMLREMTARHTNPVIYLEVPNVRTVLRDMSVWTIIYEHCLYLGTESLTRAFLLAGFDVLGSSEYYQGQFLGMEAVPAAAPRRADAPGTDIGDLAGAVASFSNQFDEIRLRWKSRLERIGQNGDRAVIWGAGARTVGWCNALRVHEQVPYAVDINPSKHGTYLAGTAQKIVEPEFLKSYKPTVVIVMNSVYKEEIASDIRRMGLDVAYEYA